MKRNIFLNVALMLLVQIVWGTSYNVTGKVLETRKEEQVAVIHHDAVEDLMPGMTMPFRVQDSEEFAKLKRGDIVTFSLVIEEAGSFAKDFTVTGKIAALPKSGVTDDDPIKLKTGSKMPRYALVDSKSEQVVPGYSDKELTLITFIFTRCPVPEYCPLMGQKFRSIQGDLKDENLGATVGLLSITIDPEFDTPEKLNLYGNAVGADTDIWRFATGGPDEIDRLTKAFRVYVERDGVRLEHGLCTALIGAEGNIIDIWRGNGWSSDEVMERIRSVVTKPKAVN